MISADFRSEDPLIEPLTSREREILVLLAEGNSDAEIASALVLSPNTVKWYNREIYSKLGVGKRREAVARARELGILEPPAPPSTPPSNLPAPLTPFLGRQEERDAACTLLRGGRTRLLTLAGPGGMGKTRLAIEVASSLLVQDPGGFRDGVFFVALASVNDPESIAPSLAQAIGFSFYQGPESPAGQLALYLRRRRILLLLDNFEQLVERGAAVVAGFLAAGPGVRILVTSRSRLNIPGEQVLPLGGLPYPARDAINGRTQPFEAAGSFSGVQLFLESANRAWPACRLDAESLAPVVEICELVQGMPLGIELAAAWMAVMTPAEIAAEIKGSLDFLSTGGAGLPERQQSLRAVFDASWGLLTPAERDAMQRLSVFRGRFDRTAARDVCGVSSETLLSLANKSWIQRAPDGGFGMHELAKQYGAEKLAADPEAGFDVRNRHSRYFCDWLAGQELGLKGPHQDEVWVSIRAVIEDCTAACVWAAAGGRAGRLQGAVTALGLFYYRGYGFSRPGQQAFRALGEALASDERSKPGSTAGLLLTRARIEMWSATYASLIGNEAEGHARIEESLALLDHALLAGEETRPERAHLALQLGYLEMNRDASAARRYMEQSLALYRDLGDEWGTAYAYLGYGRAVRNLNVLDEAQAALQHSLALHLEIGNRLGQGETLATLGGLAIRRAELEEAERLIRRSLDITRHEDRYGMAFGLGFLGYTQMLTGRFPAAIATLRECITAFSDLGIRINVARWSTFLALAHMHKGEYRRARERGESLLALAREIDWEGGVGYGLEILGNLALAKGDYTGAYESLAESIRITRQITRDRRDVGFLAWLGLAARGLARREEAWQCLRASLEWAANANRLPEQLVAVSGVALLLADEGELEWATGLYATVRRHPFAGRSRWFDDVIGQEMGRVARGLAPDSIQRAQARGPVPALQATSRELIDKLREYLA